MQHYPSTRSPVRGQLLGVCEIKHEFYVQI